jgi:hypothetical protein
MGSKHLEAARSGKLFVRASSTSNADGTVLQTKRQHQHAIRTSKDQLANWDMIYQIPTALAAISHDTYNVKFQ